MTLTYAHLIETRICARKVKEDLSALYDMLISFDIIPDPKLTDNPTLADVTCTIFEQPALRFDDMGLLCDDITKFCTTEIKKLDDKLEKKIQKKSLPIVEEFTKGTKLKLAAQGIYEQFPMNEEELSDAVQMAYRGWYHYD